MPDLTTHIRPINLQAAKVFWKAPWWAKISLEDKTEVIRTTAKIEDLVDVNCPPPTRPGGGHNQIPDLRGTKVRHKSRGLVALVLGYAFSAPQSHNVRRDNRTNHQTVWWNGNNWNSVENQGSRGFRNEQRWYALFEGKVQIIKSRHWKLAGNYDRITPP